MKIPKPLYLLLILILLGATLLTIKAKGEFLSGYLGQKLPHQQQTPPRNNTIKINSPTTADNISSGYCYVDNLLKIGAFVAKTADLGTIDQNITGIKVPPINGLKVCKGKVTAMNYRFAEFYKTTPEFALVCTVPCTIKDQPFLNASFEGAIKAIDTIKNEIGYLPKNKIEFHVGQDGDCFKNGYGNQPAGSGGGGIGLICNATYYWYLDSQQYPNKQDLAYISSLKSQTLTIHEPIHAIFYDYKKTNSEPSYSIQESFCKGISLTKVGTISNFGDQFLADQFSINNPPYGNNQPTSSNFLVYSLNHRFGFDIGPLTKQFFDLYRNDATIYANEDDRVKGLLDKVLKQNTKPSFDDIGMNISN